MQTNIITNSQIFWCKIFKGLNDNYFSRCTTKEPASDWMQADYDTTDWVYPNLPLSGNTPEGMPEDEGKWIGYLPADRLWCRVAIPELCMYDMYSV